MAGFVNNGLKHLRCIIKGLAFVIIVIKCSSLVYDP
jgi:hypothetical protein